jgi:hypothetical protein
MYETGFKVFNLAILDLSMLTTNLIIKYKLQL